MGVKIIDKGFKNYYKALDYLDTKQIAVGIFENKGQEVLTKAVVNEYGSPKKRIPERSFTRSTYNQHFKKVSKQFKQIIKGISKNPKLSNRHTINKQLKLIGVKYKFQVKKTITDLKTPPNAPSTIAKKGSSNPLIDTGELRASVASQLRNK